MTGMSWIAGSLFRSYQERRRLRHAAMERSAPPVEYPCLGLGGRSIELSIGEGVRPSSAAFELAADEIEAHVRDHDWDPVELRVAAAWLVERWPDDAPIAVRQRLAEYGGRSDES
jgi:hypothetical protein